MSRVLPVAIALAATTGVVLPGAPAAAATTYQWHVTTYTSNLDAAGTNARVYVRIYGSKGSTGALRLDNPGADDLEPGNIDGFTVSTTTDIGPEATGFRIWHDNSGNGPGWHLGRLMFTKSGSSTTIDYPIGRWLATNMGDGATCLRWSHGVAAC